MEAASVVYQRNDDMLDNRITRLQNSINALEMVIRLQQQRPFLLPYELIRRYPVKKKPVLVFPLNVLDRKIERFVKTVVTRWIVRMRKFLGLTKHRT